MNGIPVQEFTAALAAHADCVAAGPAPIDRVLAGARRRAARRRAAVAVTAAAVIAGVAAGLGGAFSGSHGSGTQQVPPGQRSSAPGKSDPPAHRSSRHIPAFTQQPGQGDVVASGTEDGESWQVTMTIDTSSTGARTLRLELTDAGAVVDGGGFRDDASNADGAEAQMTLLPTYAWFALVPPDVVDVAWTGSDGFRHDQATLPARSYDSLGELRMVVFPSRQMDMQVGDRFIGFDAFGRQVRVVAQVVATPK